MSEPTGIEAKVCADIAARQMLGLAKYGQSVADNPLSLRAWLQHAYEECLDQAIYLRRAMAEIDAHPAGVREARPLTDREIDALCVPGRAQRWQGDGRQYDRDTARLIERALATSQAAAPAPATRATECGATPREQFEAWWRSLSLDLRTLPTLECAAWNAWMARAALAARPPESIPIPAIEQRDGWRDVLAERQRQVSVEGWTPEHDDEHDTCELAAAAACYAVGCRDLQYPSGEEAWPGWIWRQADQRRNLVKAGALILAEIDRLDRAALATPQPTGGRP